MSFNVIAESKPPSNIHVLIGRNGTGKTTLIKNLLHALYSDAEQYGKFSYTEEKKYDIGRFANVICIAFSPFDSYPDQLNMENSPDKIIMPYSFIGLNKTSADLPASIFEQFFSSFELCISNEHKKSLLLRSLDILMSDPTFFESGIRQLIENNIYEEAEVRPLFQALSSGHKVVLLIITCCVEKISEQTLVMIDEPENHLHPPLLSALIRALSELLISRNGVAIVSTHSPVVLQEVPSNCVWMLRRTGGELIAERPQLQSFGAGVGTLTNEVFGLEVNKSGFHRLLAEAAKCSPDYAHALTEFDGQLGDEAQIILRSMISAQKDVCTND